MKYLEDLKPGERIELGSHTFTADEIKHFARRYDPQPFHLDEDAAKRSHFGALCASGWHTALIWMRLFSVHEQAELKTLLAAGDGAATGPSPGFRDLKWLKPVYAGDTISYAWEVIATRVSQSRPRWGLLTMRNTGANQRGEPVLSFTSTLFVERRPS